MNIQLPGLSQPLHPATQTSAAATAEQPATGSAGDTSDQPAVTTGQDSRELLESAVQSMQSFAQSISRDLDFRIDDDSGRVVVQVIASDSGELIRQIPSEEALKLAEHLNEMRSLLIRDQA